MVTDSTEKAEILNKQLKSVFTVEDTSTVPDKGTSPYPSIPDINVTLDGVRNLLLKSDLNKSAGPDNILLCFRGARGKHAFGTTLIIDHFYTHMRMTIQYNNSITSCSSVYYTPPLLEEYYIYNNNNNHYNYNNQ